MAGKKLFCNSRILARYQVAASQYINSPQGYVLKIPYRGGYHKKFSRHGPVPTEAPVQGSELRCSRGQSYACYVSIAAMIISNSPYIKFLHSYNAALRLMYNTLIKEGQREI